MRIHHILFVLIISTFALTAESGTAAQVSSPFKYTFLIDSVVEETNLDTKSPSPYWWVSSGAELTLEEGRGKTNQGKLPLGSKWQVLYAVSNPLDTEDGFYPQNIFRLVSRNKWQDFTQQIYFQIKKDNLSTSPNRNASNGLLLFNRYQDQNNLYYAGLRVDGVVVVKKKINGKYYTLGYKKIFPGNYNAVSNPNLLPHNKWLGVKSKVVNNSDGSVSISVYYDFGWTGNWAHLISVKDDNKKYGPVISAAGYGGIRTDFMDVIFDQYVMTSI